MKIMRWLAAGALALGLVACGGGGSEPLPGKSSGGGGGGGGGGQASSGPTLALSITSGVATSGSPATITATLRDAESKPIAGRVIDFGTVRGLGELSVLSEVTNGDGVAQVQVRPAQDKPSGADEVIALAKLGTTTIQASVPFKTTAQAAILSASVLPTTIKASSPGRFTVVVQDKDGRLRSGQLVRFSSVNGLVVLGATTAATNPFGQAAVDVFVKDPSVSGADQIVAVTTLDGKDLSSSSTVSVVREVPVLELGVEKSAIKGGESTTVTVLLTDAARNPLKGRLVSFSSMFGLGQFSPSSQATDEFGIAKVQLTAKSSSTSAADYVVAAATVNSVSLQESRIVQYVPATGEGVPSLQLILKNGQTTVTTGSPATVEATVLNKDGLPVPGKVVTFTSLRGLGDFNVTTALTDALGRAVVSVYPVNSTVSGADEVVASTSVGGMPLEAMVGFQTQSTAVTIESFTSDVDNKVLSAYGQATLTLKLAGVSVGAPVNIKISSSCLTQNKAVISPVNFSTTGAESSIQYRDEGCGAVQSKDKLTAEIVGSTEKEEREITIASPGINSVAFVSAHPEVIYLKGSGYGETSRVTFEVRDVAGNPLPNKEVTLSLVSKSGGVMLEQSQEEVVRKTDNMGRVSVIVNSGTVPTPIRVRARITSNNQTIETVSSALSVAVGLPSQLNFSLSQTAHNIEGFNIDGTENQYSIFAADRVGNPVPAGTSINFVTEGDAGGGQVEPVRQIALVNGIARTTANFVSQGSRPLDGRVTVTAYALGEESFLDQNGNNIYDQGEPFQDLGTVYRDRFFDGVFDLQVDETIPLGIAPTKTCVLPDSFADVRARALLALNPSIPSVGQSTCDGVWGKAYVRRSIETVLSTSASDLVWPQGLAVGLRSGAVLTHATTAQLREDHRAIATTYRRVAGSSITNAGGVGSFNVLVRDANPPHRPPIDPTAPLSSRLNPVAAGSVITVDSTSGLTVKVEGGSPVASSLEATLANISYEFEPTAFAGQITIRVTSPSGLITAVGISISR